MQVAESPNYSGITDNRGNICVYTRVYTRREMYTRVRTGWMKYVCTCAFRKIVAPVTPTLGYRLTVTDPPYNARVSIATLSVPDLSTFYTFFTLLDSLDFFFFKENVNCGLSMEER